MPWFGQEVMLDAQAKGPLTDAAYVQARQRAQRLAGREGIDAALAHDHLDVLIAPTDGPPFVTDLINGDHVLGGGITSPPPSPAIRTSPCRWARFTVCRWASRSSARHSANLR